jgi:Tol biopolymer transport system component
METTEVSDTNRFIRLGVALGILIVGMLVLLLIWRPWEVTQSFSRLGNPRILYLGWEEEEGSNQLYFINPDGSEQKRLTNEPLGILDFAVSPDGTQIVYSAITEEGGADIWQIDTDGRGRKRLLACSEATCTQLEWAPDGRRLIYERYKNSVPGEIPSSPQLWWLDTQTGETIAVFEDEQKLGLGARISPNGRYLSYISPPDQEIHVYDIETGENLVIPSQTGEPGIWSPDSESLLISDMQFQGEQFSIHLFRTDLESAELTNISGADLETNDGLPVFSLDGEWIAFSRKKPQAPMGKQLWLMHPDGSEPAAITENADVHYNNPAWSPDGTQIVMQGYFLTEPEPSPELWVADVETGKLEELGRGMQPVWLP